jgi:hypothetical protein
MLLDELTLLCSWSTWDEDICLLRSSRVARNRQSHPRLVNTTREAHHAPVCLRIQRERRVVQQVDAPLRPVGCACSQLRGQLPSVQNKPIVPPRNPHFAQRCLGVAVVSFWTFAEEIKAVGGVNVPTLPKANILIETVYTRDDGSGTFFAQKHVFLIINEDGTQTNTPISFKGGTGDYVRP